MKYTRAAIFSLLILGLASMAFTLYPSANTPTNKPAVDGIEWISFQEMVERQKEEPRKVIIDVYTDWCGWCKRMDQTTFSNSQVSQYINDKFYAVKMDGEGKEEITFKGHTFKFVPNGRRGYHELPAALMQGKMSYPTIVFLDEEVNLIQPLPGFKTVQQIMPILTYLGDDHYKSTKWTDYAASYSAGE